MAIINGNFSALCLFVCSLGILWVCTDGLVCSYLDSPQKRRRDTHAYAAAGSIELHSLSIKVQGGVLLSDNVLNCSESEEYIRCYSYFTADPNDPNNMTIYKQGCWGDQSHQICTEGYCEAKEASRNSGNAVGYFCCCKGDMCNHNISTHLPPLTTVSTPVPDITLVDPNYKRKTIVIALSSVTGVATVTILVYLVIRCCCTPERPYLMEEDEHLVATTPTYDLDTLKLVEQHHHGKFGDIWKATLSDMDVAVKVFGPSQRQYYINEKDIYTLPHINHTSIPKFLGAEERLTVDGMSQYLIVMTYMPHGSLMSYLKHHTVTWTELCNLCSSLVSGLAFLHSVIVKGDQNKPAIAHRDLNSRNVLVKPDLTCAICDFGFAMKISGGNFYRNGQQENAEHASLNDVGTVRYMAPEVLEGAVNLRDCESSLKQIDMYALGLIFWEIGTQCSDLHQGMPTPDYKLPFEKEAGSRPTFEEMQMLVSKNKIRPAFGDTWKDSNPAIQSFKETIEDSWDHDAEARLTAFCVEVRVVEMQTLWEMRHKGITPTMLVSGCLGDLEEKATVQRNLPITNYSSQICHQGQSGSSHDADSGHSMQPRISQSDLSGGSTTDTMVTMSPMDSNGNNSIPVNKSNCNLNYARNHRVLPTHQGTNPTVERNTHKRSDEELAIFGNTLLDKSKASTGNEMSKSGLSSDTLANELLDVLTDNLESSLVQNDMLNQQNRHNHAPPTIYVAPQIHPNQSIHHTHQPIPYLQNHVSSESSMVNSALVRPKQPNVPGNGRTHPQRQVAPIENNPRFNGGKSKKAKSEGKHGSNFFHALFGRKSKRSDNQSEPLRGILTENGAYLGENNDENGHQMAPMTTEVHLVNGAPVVRPSELPVTSLPGMQDGGQYITPDDTVHEHQLGIAEVGVAKLEHTVHGERPAVVQVHNLSNTDIQTEQKPPPVKVRNKARSNLDLSPNGSWSSSFGDSDNDKRIQRPSSLSLTGHNYTKCNGTHELSAGKRKSAGKIDLKMEQMTQRSDQIGGGNNRPVSAVVNSNTAVHRNHRPISVPLDSLTANHTERDPTYYKNQNAPVAIVSDRGDLNHQSGISLKQFSQPPSIAVAGTRAADYSC